MNIDRNETLFGKTYLTEIELSKYLDVSVAGLREMRKKGEGIQWRKINGAIVYDISNIREYEKICSFLKELCELGI